MNDQPRSIFLSSSIPNEAYQEVHGEIDPLEITAAVVAVVRGALMSGTTIVTATHPTIAPLILYVAEETRGLPGAAVPPAIVYQSLLFRPVMPAETMRLATEAGAELIWTPAAPGDRPERGFWDRSLEVMRNQMLRHPSIVGAVFIGGMEGIEQEHALFRELRPGLPVFAFAAPGGQAGALVDASHSDAREQLRVSRVYPAVFRTIAAILGLPL